jgi:hypothetical protein
MKTTILLRITSILSLLFAVLHTLGGTKSWSPVGDNEAFRVMRSFRFDVEGVSRTYLDFYVGFGFTVSVYQLLQAVLLWQLATIAKTDSIQARPLIVSFFVASLACMLVAKIFIFTVPAVFSAVIAVCLGVTIYSTKAGGVFRAEKKD